MNFKVMFAGLFIIIFGVGAYGAYDYKIRPEIESGKLYREAQITAQRGGKDAYNLAIAEYIKVMAAYPKASYARKSYIALSDLYEKIGLYRNAYINYNYILKTYRKKLTPSEYQDVMARIASLKLKQYRTEEGMNQLYTILNQTQDNNLRSRIYSEIGYAWLKYGSLSKSLQAFNLSLSENANNEESILGRARVFVRQGNYEDAFGVYDHFLRYHGEMSLYAADVRKTYLSQSYDYGLTSFRKGRYNSAIFSFDKLIRNFSGSNLSENALYWTGESYYRLGQYSNAVRVFTKTLTNGYSGKDEDARLKRGFAYFSLKEYVRAVKDFQSYLDSYPKGRNSSTAQKWKDEALALIAEKEHVDAVPDVPMEENKSDAVDQKMSGGTLHEESAPEVNEESADDSEVAGDDLQVQQDTDELEDITEL